MQSENSFLQAIAANISADGPKLAFSDWLEERGDPRSGAWRWLVETHKHPMFYEVWSGDPYPWGWTATHHRSRAHPSAMVPSSVWNMLWRSTHRGCWFATELDAIVALAEAFVQVHEQIHEQVHEQDKINESGEFNGASHSGEE